MSSEHSPPTFHPGHLTKKALAALAAKKPKPKTLKPKWAAPYVELPSYLIFKNQKRWFLLPEAHVQPDVWVAINRGCPCFSSANKMLREFQDPKKKFYKNSTFDSTVAVAAPPFLGTHSSPVFLKNFRMALKRNIQLRARMRALLLKWLATRKMRAANTEDIYTLEFPKKPVFVASWANRVYYVFDVNTILRDITEKLLLCDSMFVVPVYPRNPYTNDAFTLPQLLSIRAQLRAYGRTNWAFEAFAASRWCLVAFKRKYEIPLKYSALNRLFQDITKDDYIGTLFQFIQDEHSEHDLPCNRQLYSWALQHYARSPIIMKWRKLCYRYYEIMFIHTDIDQVNDAHDAEIGPATRLLCRQNGDIIRARMKWLAKISGARRVHLYSSSTTPGRLMYTDSGAVPATSSL